MPAASSGVAWLGRPPEQRHRIAGGAPARATQHGLVIAGHQPRAGGVGLEVAFQEGPRHGGAHDPADLDAALPPLPVDVDAERWPKLSRQG